MNDRNVAALDLLLGEAGLPPRGPSRRQLAEALAARGVLVPSALTDDQCKELEACFGLLVDKFDDKPFGLRAELERIAKGEGFP